MNESPIHVFNHQAMATVFQVRIADEQNAYAAQAARAAFDVVDHLESLLSRFRENSEVSQIAFLAPGESMRLSEPVFACLEIAHRMEIATGRAFSATPAALKAETEFPRWSLLRDEMCIRCESGTVDLDLGAIGKGFALDRMAESLLDWDCSAFLLIAGGSSILAGSAPSNAPGWSTGLGEDNSDKRFWLANGSLSGSGVAVKGEHILDPRTGRPAARRNRAWAWARDATESDALSTACMVLTESEIEALVGGHAEWAVLLQSGGEWRQVGRLPLTECGSA